MPNFNKYFNKDFNKKLDNDVPSLFNPNFDNSNYKPDDTSLISDAPKNPVSKNIVYIEDKRRREYVYKLRNATLLKKAGELSIMTGIQIYVCIEDIDGGAKVFQTPKFKNNKDLKKQICLSLSLTEEESDINLSSDNNNSDNTQKEGE